MCMCTCYVHVYVYMCMCMCMCACLHLRGCRGVTRWDLCGYFGAYNKQVLVSVFRVKYNNLPDSTFGAVELSPDVSWPAVCGVCWLLPTMLFKCVYVYAFVTLFFSVSTAGHSGDTNNPRGAGFCVCAGMCVCVMYVLNKSKPNQNKTNKKKNKCGNAWLV